MLENALCDAEEGVVRLAAGSFRGGVGACSAIDESVAEGASAKGPSGSPDPSTASSRVGCNSAFRAGTLREAPGRVAVAGAVVVFEGADSPAGLLSFEAPSAFDGTSAEY